MKLIILSSLLLSFSIQAQTNRFSNISLPPNGISDNSTVYEVKTIEMLGKIDLISTVESSLPSNYNWTADLRKREAIERVTSQPRQQDSFGRDIPLDINELNTTILINRNRR